MDQITVNGCKYKSHYSHTVSSALSIVGLFLDPGFEMSSCFDSNGAATVLPADMAQV